MQLLFLRSLRTYTISIFTCVMLFTTGCEDDDHNNDDEVHTDADGFILENESGTEVYREFEGAITGSVSLSVGDTLKLSVHILDHEGAEIEHAEDEEHEEGALAVSGSNTTIAIVDVEEDEDDPDHEEEHGMALDIIGVSSGNTSFQLQLMHDGHADYTSTNNVIVTVN